MERIPVTKMAKYEPGDKFVIEVAERYDTRRKFKNERPDVLYRMRHFNSAVFDERALDKLARLEDMSDSKDEFLGALECLREIETVFNGRAASLGLSDDKDDQEETKQATNAAIAACYWAAEIVEAALKKYVAKYGRSLI